MGKVSRTRHEKELPIYTSIMLENEQTVLATSDEPRNHLMSYDGSTFWPRKR
jgi:hypothetical protein